ncbi:MAG: Clp protease N-terminal domain-containing protein [Phycisphaerae bacterium]
MHERFSDRARHAMALANLEASKLHHQRLVPAHLMLGLIAEGHCVATEALQLLNVDLKAVRNEVHAQLKEQQVNKDDGARSQSDELKEVISLAIKEAREYRHKYVGTEHLILGLLEHEGSIPSKVLHSQGIDERILRDKVVSVLQSPGEADHDLTHSRHGHFEWVHQQELAKAFRSPKFWHTMILAVDSANRYGDGQIDAWHILLALARDTDTDVSKALSEKGMTEDWLRDQVN